MTRKILYITEKNIFVENVRYDTMNNGILMAVCTTFSMYKKFNVTQLKKTFVQRNAFSANGSCQNRSFDQEN